MHNLKHKRNWALICIPLQDVASLVVRSLGRKDPLEKGMATHLSILVWRIPWTEEPGGLQSMGSQNNEKPLHHNKSRPPSPQLEKACMQQ